MKLRLFISGILVGGAIGMMVGAAVVEVPGDDGGKRKSPQGLALMMALVGAVAAGSVMRGSGPLGTQQEGDDRGQLDDSR